MAQEASSSNPRTIFVTVGTTLFEALIQGVTTEDALAWMVSNSYSRLIIQYGKGKVPTIPEFRGSSKLRIEMYDYKPSLMDDMRKSDLIVSHAGAGTVMEVLRLRKRLVVVINTILMHNHQTELANAMGDRGHLFVVDSPDKLREKDMKVWDALRKFVPKPYVQGNEHDFPRLLDSFLGFLE